MYVVSEIAIIMISILCLTCIALCGTYCFDYADWGDIIVVTIPSPPHAYCMLIACSVPEKCSGV